MSVRIVECGCCGCYHRTEYFGDCRNDDERFPAEEVAAKRLKVTTLEVERFEYDLQALPIEGTTEMRSATELAQAVREERMDFDDALLEYLMENHLDRLDLSFFMTMKTVIGYAAMGQWQRGIPFSEDEELTVQQVIDEFGLGPFVEAETT